MSGEALPDPADRDCILAAWGLSHAATFAPLGNGLINRTLLVRDHDRRGVLQRLNTRVFRDPELVMRNCRVVTDRLAHERVAGRYPYAVLELVPTPAGELAAVLPDGSWWRMYTHVPAAITHETAGSASLAREAGRGFGAFAAALAGLPTTAVGDVIARFHDPVARFDAFRAALAADRVGRANGAAQTCAAALAYADVLAHWRTLRSHGLPARVTHNDCKLNNLLFDEAGRAVCVIDLDTVMPGTVLFDFGDIARTMVSPVREDSADLDGIHVRHDYFAALARGYVEGSGGMLTAIELDNLAFAARLVSGVMGLRFLTDYLDGDRYYRVDHPAHNLERARNQFTLYAALTAQADALQALVPRSA